MTRTTIELPAELRDKLKAERLDHESNYAETIERLLGEDATDYVTESEIRSIVSDMVVVEALE